jgi:hypothetical protein
VFVFNDGDVILDDEGEKALAAIRADADLLEWARYSIRYNGTRMQQAYDFDAKLKLNGVPLLFNTQALAMALAKLEKTDLEE